MDRFYSASAKIIADEEAIAVHTAVQDKHTVIFGGSLCNTSGDKIAKVTVQIVPEGKYIIKDAPVVMDSTLFLNKMVLNEGSTLMVSSTGADIDCYVSYCQNDILEDIL